MREKLIKMIWNCRLRCTNHLCVDCEKLADEFIANGVTVQGDKDINVPTKWISVKDRLPDAWVDVLSCDRNKNLTVDCVDEKGKWYSEYTDLEQVTHWQPLPEPPKGESNENNLR